MTDRTHNLAFGGTTCKSKNCHAPSISARIREKTQIDFDFVKYIDVSNRSTSFSIVGKNCSNQLIKLVENKFSF
jgi:hypothetical protein